MQKSFLYTYPAENRLITNPELILADEPTGALDQTTGKEIMEVFKKVHEMGKTIILITHDPNVAAYADRIIRIEDGKIIN